MAALDARTEKDVERFATEVQAVLGERLVGIVLYGSAAGSDFVAGRSDVNTAIIVDRVTPEVLVALAPVIARWRPRRFALPLLVDPEYLARARDVFPMELEDIRRQHRVLAGDDVFATLTTDREALRRECEREARGKQLRLRALFLETANRASAFEGVVVGSLKSFLLLLRHLLVLHGQTAPEGYEAIVVAGEALVGPLPVMRRLLAHRSGNARRPAAALRADFAAYLEEVERIVTAVDRVHV